MSNSGQSSSRRTEDERLDLTHAEVSETQSGISSDLSAPSARKPDTKVASKPRIFSGQSKPSQDGLNLGELVANRYEIRESLGKGGFGAVYRAHDRELNRVVAIKRSNGLRSFVAGQIRNEAQSVASLNHPNIIAIYDLITVTDDDLLIVMECLEGSPLSQRLQQPRISVQDAVRIAIQVASALQHAHERLLVHSDLKPGNLYLCEDGRVKLLDFGLAVAYFPDESAGRVGGTPGYMAPEQIRGESHRIDGRADIFALGVVLYEMLTGSKPFVGSDSRSICEATLRKEVPPPRQLNANIDEALQRIILKCLEKRIVDRYDSATALEDDLKRCLEVQAESADFRVATQPNSRSGGDRPSGRTSLRLRERGLQPYTEADGDSYLRLIPGPRGHDGIPDSILFWKRWVESDDSVHDYPVGVLYGPSGGGKTSYVRAGLLNQLDRDICKVYVECRPGDLGGRLSRIIQSRIREDSNGGSSLQELLTRIRSGSSHSRGFRKLLIVLDQFEAWSHSASFEERQDFADALRQCDGEQIRALVVTRDDYWSGVRELLRWIELPLQEGRNVASVDLLDPPHARLILEAMGRESGTLPPEQQPLTSGQQQFIHQAVEELASGGYVICVHLVMFAQMVRLQTWSPRSLRRGGGVAGACSLFLQELFSKSGKSSPEYRLVADAVAPILRELMPLGDSTVATVRIPRTRLATAVESAGCRHLFDDCLRILCDDLRIVTVVADDDPASSSQNVTPDHEESDRSGGESDYRLSHDFLVQPINHWLDRVEQRTWRGRAKRRLTEMSEAWSRRPTTTHLPGFGEYFSLVLGSRLQNRSETESRYLRAATRFHAGRISVAALFLIGFLMMTVIAWRQWTVAAENERQALAANIDLLFNGPPGDVTRQIAELKNYGNAAVEEIEPWTGSVNRQARFRSQLFIQSLTPDSIAGIAKLIEEASPELFTPILEIARQADDAKTELLPIANSSPSMVSRSRAAILLAYLDDLTAIETLLAGSDDAEQDQTVLLEAASWRGGPAPWVKLVTADDDPQVRYHAAVILGSYPAEDLQETSLVGELQSLINAPQAAVHSAGRYLADHLGEDPYGVELNPADDADWRVGPDNIPMIRIDPIEFDYEPVRNDSGVTYHLTIKDQFWVATIPVSRRLFSQFAESDFPLPAGLERPNVSVEGFNMPEALKNDESQPMVKLKLDYAYAFCNWLSEREGLAPCYEYAPPDPEPTNAKDFVPPPIPWKTIETADGFRLPTYSQYNFALRAGYKTGIPWKHVNQISANYQPAASGRYTRRLFSLIPNRRGLFFNDGECGVWLSGHRMYSNARIGSYDIMGSSTRSREVHRYGIYLVQIDPAESTTE